MPFAMFVFEIQFGTSNKTKGYGYGYGTNYNIDQLAKL